MDQEGFSHIPAAAAVAATRRVAFSENHTYHRIPSSPRLSTHHENILDSSNSNNSSSSSRDEGKNLWTQELDLENNKHNSKRKSLEESGRPRRRKNNSNSSNNNANSSSRRSSSSSWSSWETLQNTLKENLQNSWHLGFLWPDEEEEEEEGDEEEDFLQHERRTCDDDDHAVAAAAAAALDLRRKQEQQQQQEETASLLQSSSAKLGFSPSYGTWNSGTEQQQQQEQLMIKHSQSAPSFVVLDDDDIAASSQETNGATTEVSFRDLKILVAARGSWDDAETDKLASSSSSCLLHSQGSSSSCLLHSQESSSSSSSSSSRALPSALPQSIKIALTLTKSMPAAMCQVKKCLHRCNTAPAMSAPAAAAVAAAANNPDSNNNNNNSDVGNKRQRPPQLSQSSGSTIVMQAGVGLMLYLAAGVLIYTWKRKEFAGLETVSYVDALYFCIVTMCTIGYGDITPTTTSAKLFACGFVLVGFGFIDALLSGMVNYLLDKQEQLLLSTVEGSHYQVARRYVVNPKHGNRMRIRMKVALAAGVPVLCIIVGTFVMMQMEQLSWIDALYCTTMSITTVGKAEYVVYKLKEMGNVKDDQIHDICLQFDRLDSNNTGKITLARLQDGN